MGLWVAFSLRPERHRRNEMELRETRGAGWLAFSAIVLILGGVFAVIDGLVAVYRSTFFTSNAVYVFSGLHTWGWIVFGLGVAAVAAGLAVYTGREWARWLGVGVAAVAMLGQLLFAQAYPLWSLTLMAIYGVVIYGLVAHGDWRAQQALGQTRSETPVIGQTGSPAGEQERRAA
jgi:hypothetical protein